MTDLHVRAEAIAAGMTPTRYWQNLGTGQCYMAWYRHFAEGPHCSREQAKRDAIGIGLLGTVRHELLAVVRAAANLTHYGNCEGDCGNCDIINALKAYDAALKRELGGEG